LSPSKKQLNTFDLSSESGPCILGRRQSKQLNPGDPSQPEVALDAFAQLNFGDCHKVFYEHFYATTQRKSCFKTIEDYDWI